MKSTVTRYRIGDMLASCGTPGLIGEVVALRDISPTRQVLTIKTTEGTVVPVTVDLADGGTIVLPPSSLPEAVALATAITAGTDPHMSVSTQLAILANAVIAMSAGVIQPKEAVHSR